MLKLLMPCCPKNDTLIALLPMNAVPTLSISLPLISIGVAAAPNVAVVEFAGLPLPPTIKIPLPAKNEIVLLLIVPVVMCAVVLGEPCAKTWIASPRSALGLPDIVLLEMFRLLIVPFQVS